MSPDDRRARRWLLGALAVSVVLLVGLGWFLGVATVLFPPAGGTIELADYTESAVRDATEATDELCPGLDGCIEAYASPHGDYRRFRTIEQAAAHGGGDEDVVVDRHITIAFPDGTPSELRSSQRELLRSTHRSD